MNRTEAFLQKILKNLPFETCIIKNGALSFRNDPFSCSIDEAELLTLVSSRDEVEYECNFITNGRMFSLRKIHLDPVYSVFFLNHPAEVQLSRDPLTGILHRECFAKVAQQLMETAKRLNGILGILFVDLDGFKTVNDTWGHDNGDQVLKTTAKRIANVIRDKDFCFRLGGDEFLIILNEIKERMHSCLVARRLISSISEPIPIAGANHVQVGSSIGISSYPHDGATIEVLVSKADEAMYRAKKLGKNNYQLCHKKSES
jgi:diguanylate cyclase (GGDEF)-like protein